MKKLVLILGTTLGTILAVQAQAGTLECAKVGTRQSFTIQENVPSLGLATVIEGVNQTVMNFTETVTGGGCFILHKKEFFHPYFDIHLSQEIGKDNTRCAGMDSGISGFQNAEMQAPVELKCIYLGGK